MEFRKRDFLRSISSNCIAVDADALLVDSSLGVVTITLPKVTLAARVSVKKVDASMNAVTVIAHGSETIDGSVSLIISSKNEGYSLISDGENWYISMQLPIVPKSGNSNFGGSDGVTIEHSLHLLDYSCDITPTADSSAVGAIWVTDFQPDSFIVKNSGIGVSSFMWAVRPLRWSGFTIVVLPDTQKYCVSHPDIFTKQTQWIADARNYLNIKFVVHVGDIVDHGSVIDEWENANTSMSILDNKVPYLVIPGNHDFDDLCQGGGPKDASTYNMYFPYTRFEGYDWWGGHYPSDGNQNNYGFFSVGGEEFLVLGLAFCPTDAELNWADSILNSYPNKKVIIFTHSYMFRDDTRADCAGYSNACCTYGCCGDCNSGEEMWNNLIKNHSNVVLVTSGHFLGDGLGMRVDYVDEHPINQILQNYQMEPNGGDGWLRYYTFKPDEKKIEARTYSPYLDRFETSPSNQFILSYT